MLLIVCACCMTSSPGYAGQEDTRIFLWSVPTGKNTVYILGSVHVLKKDAYPLDRRIEDAYRASEILVFEADMTEVAQPATRMKMIEAGMYRDGTTLKQHISRDTYEMFGHRVAGAGMSMDLFEPLKPWLCAITLSGLELRRMGYDPALGIDAHFFARAQQDEKDLIFLESSDFQIELLAEVLGDNPEDLLRQTMKELDVIGEMSADMLAAWGSGDADRMEAIVGISLKEYPRIRERLFIERNTDWTTKIEKLAGKDKDALVIVGAAHLVGEGGVLALLRQRGYSVIQQ